MARIDFILPKMVRRNIPVVFIGLSLLAHTLILYSFGIFARFDFATPVLPTRINVVLSDPPLQQQLSAVKEKNVALPPATATEQQPAQLPEDLPTALPPDLATPAIPMPEIVSSQTVSQDLLIDSVPALNSSGPTSQPLAFVQLKPFRISGEFMPAGSETLNYRISLFGMPVGNAQLAARSDKGDVWITLKVASDPMISGFYPVDDLIEIRHINGNFITAKIRQKEGTFTGDRRFTLFLRDKSVFWIDRLTNKSLRESIPTSDVVDLLSGLYYLRNRQLKVGSVEMLHVYDSDKYIALPVDVLRRETVKMSGFREINALVIQPQLKTAGTFRLTGAIQIWLSDDEYRVPVKVVSTIGLGRITAELVSAESENETVSGRDGLARPGS